MELTREQVEALKTVINGAKRRKSQLTGIKRKNQNEVWELAVLTRDIMLIETLLIYS